MKINGYGCEVEWDGHTLRAKGTNKAAHFALMGQNNVDAHDYIQPDQKRADMAKGLGKFVKDSATIPDELVLEAGDFTVEKFKTANALTNGNLILRTSDGRKYQLHFRKKHNTDFQALANALGA